MLVELLCLLVFSLRLVHYARVIPRDKFWRDPKNICIMAVITVGGACLQGYTFSWGVGVRTLAGWPLPSVS